MRDLHTLRVSLARVAQAFFTADQMLAYGAECARAEREACAKVCDAFEWPGRRHTDYIQGQNDAFDKCAAAIRARSET